MHNINWDDFRYVLAVCEAGSLNGAARALGVNHATVLRRVKAFEEQLGKPIFIKTRTGYNFDPNAGDILNTLKEMQNSAEKIRRVLGSASTGVSGTVKITSTDGICKFVLPKIIDQIQAKYNSIHIELWAANRHLNMFQPEADITVRPSQMAPEGLVTYLVPQIGFKIYATPEFWTKYQGNNFEEIPWYSVSKLLQSSLVGQWMSKNVPENTIKLHADSYVILSELLKGSRAASFLPCIVGDCTAGLVTNPKFDLKLTTNVWVACHEDLIDNPHIQVCMDMLRKQLSDQAAQLYGQ